MIPDDEFHADGPVAAIASFTRRTARRSESERTSILRLGDFEALTFRLLRHVIDWDQGILADSSRVAARRA